MLLIWRFLEGQRLRYFAALIALLLASFILYLVPLVPQIVFDGVLSASEEEPAGHVRWAVSFLGGEDHFRQNLWLAAVAMMGLSVAAGFFTYLKGRWSALASEDVARRVRERLYDHLQHLPARYFDTAETGDLVQRCTSDVETLRAFLASQVVEIGRASFMLIVPIPLMWMLSPAMTGVALAMVPIIVVFCFVYFRRIRGQFKEVDESEGRLTTTLQENLTGIRVVRAFARQDHEIERFAVRNADYREQHCRLYVLLARFWATSDALCMIQIVLVLAAGAVWLLEGQLAAGTFVFFVLATNLYLWPVRMLGRILADLGKAIVAIGRIDEILSVPRESEPAMSAPTPEGGFRGEIRFDRVTFRHGGESPVLDEFSFHVSPGETVALLGPSGSGKSTLLNLLLRFYEPDDGRIELDGIDLSTLSRGVVRSHLAVVMQDPFLFSKTISENIRFGRSTASHGDVQQAAMVSCVHDTIEKFDQGYETVVGERGVTLSGGQRQRVALARALIDEPAVLILDDSLSAVDTETEAEILSALAERRGRHTTLVVAHRLTTLESADRIIVIEEGRKVQEGDHATLVNQPGLYRRLWALQSGQILEGDPEVTDSTPSKGGIRG